MVPSTLSAKLRRSPQSWLHLLQEGGGHGGTVWLPRCPLPLSCSLTSLLPPASFPDSTCSFSPTESPASTESLSVLIKGVPPNFSIWPQECPSQGSAHMYSPTLPNHWIYSTLLIDDQHLHIDSDVHPHLNMTGKQVSSVSANRRRRGDVPNAGLASLGLGRRSCLLAQIGCSLSLSLSLNSWLLGPQAWYFLSLFCLFPLASSLETLPSLLLPSDS